MLQEKINEDFKAAFKAHREAEISVLKNLKAVLLNKEKEKQFQANKNNALTGQTTLNDDEIIALISAEIKKLRDAKTLFERGGRADLVAQNENEIAILSHYLPPPLSEEEIKKMINQAITSVGAASIKDMGKVMGILTPQIKGRADNALIGKLVKETLTK